MFHSVHENLDFEEGGPWKKEEKRESILVFIGKNLSRSEIESGVKECLA